MGSVLSRFFELLERRGSSLCSLLVLFVLLPQAFAQRELLPVTHPVYKFLLRQQMLGTISDVHWGMLPNTRTDIAHFLMATKAHNQKLSRIDRRKLEDFSVEFEYDMQKTLLNASPLFPEFSLSKAPTSKTPGANKRSETKL